MICSFFAATSVFGQQWNGPSNTGSEIYRTGFTGIGTTNPDALLHLKTEPISLPSGGEEPITYIPVGIRLEYYSPSNTTNYHWNINSGSGLKFEYFTNQGTPTEVLNITQGTMTYYGSKIILKTNGTNQLALHNDGRIHAREVEVNLDVIPDYVFKDDYDLMPLTELRKFIDQNHHLPNIKSAAEYEAYGRIPLKELNLKLLEKVEELTLYTLEQQTQIEALQAANAEISTLKNQMAELQKVLDDLKK